MYAFRRFLTTACLFVIVNSAHGQEKTTISLAYLDDPSRFAAVYAIREGIVTSDKVTIDFTFLPLASAIEAYQTKRYDILEASSLAPAGSAARGFKTLIVSAGLVNKAGTEIFIAKDAGMQTGADLKGKTLGTAALAGSFTLETRYVLQEKYDLSVNLQSGDVRFQELPPDVSASMVKRGTIDAAILNNMPGWRMRQDPELYALLNSTEEFAELTGQPFLSSVLLTYPEVATTQGDAIREVNRMLRDSIDYYRSNAETVNNEVAKEKGIPADFLKDFFVEYDYPQGRFSEQNEKQILIVWNVGFELGAIPAVPRDISELLFR